MLATTENLNSLVEFDSAFIVTPEGIEDGLGKYVPTVYNDDETDIYIDGNGWTALAGYTGQYGYNGAVLHSSEYLGGGLARDILEDVGGIYAVTVVEDMEDSDNPAGWCVLKYVG